MSTPLHARPDAYEAVAFLDPLSGSYTRSLVVPGALSVEPAREYFARGQADQVPETSSLVLSFEDVDVRNHAALDALRHAECPVVAVAVGPFGVLQWYDATALDAVAGSHQGLHSRRVVLANRRVRPAIYEGENLCGFAGWQGLQPVPGGAAHDFYHGLWRIEPANNKAPVFDGDALVFDAGSAGTTVTLDRIWFPFGGSRLVLRAATFAGGATQRLSAHDAEGAELASAEATRPDSSSDLALTLPPETAYVRVRITLTGSTGRVGQPTLLLGALGPVAGRRIGPVLGGGLGFPAPFIPSGPGGPAGGDFFTKAESDARYVKRAGDVVLGDLTLERHLHVEQNLLLDGWADLRANVDIGGNLYLDGQLLAEGQGSFGGSLDVAGSASVAGSLWALNLRRERLGADAILEWDEAGQVWRAGLVGASSPIAVRNRALQVNLNAELWSGEHFADYLDQAVRTGDAPSWQGATLTEHGLTVPAGRGVRAASGALRLGTGSEELLRLDHAGIVGQTVVRLGLGAADGWMGRAGGLALSTLHVSSSSTTLGGNALVQGHLGVGRINPNFAATLAGDVAVTAYVGTEAFASGFLGHGWAVRQEEGRWSGELDNLTVRGALRVYELLIQRIRAAGGSYWFTDVGRPSGVVQVAPPGSPGTYYELAFETDGGELGHEFTAGDLILAQRWRWDSTSTYRSECIVVETQGPHHALVQLLGGEPPEVGAEFVRVGNASDASRRGSLYITASDSGAPYLDVLDGVASFADLAGPDKLKARHGKLSGIVDPVLGALDGYGLYTQRAYLRAGADFLTFDGSLRLETPNLKIDASGNVRMSGRVTASSGSIAGWSIAPEGLTKVSLVLPTPATAVGLLAGTLSTGLAIFAGATSATGTGANFYVRNDGYLRAENAYIAGEIRATTGLIGGLTIAANRLFKNTGGFTFAVDGAAGASVLTHSDSGHTLAHVGAGEPAPNPPVLVSNDNATRTFDNWVNSDTLYSSILTLQQGPVDITACRTIRFEAAVTVNASNTGTVRPDGTYTTPHVGYFTLRVLWQAYIDGGWRVRTVDYRFVVPQRLNFAVPVPALITSEIEIPLVTWGRHTPERATRIAQIRILGSSAPSRPGWLPPSQNWRPEYNLTVAELSITAHRPAAYLTPGGVMVYASSEQYVELGAGRARFSGDVDVGGALALGGGELREIEGRLYWREPDGNLVRLA